MRIRSSLVVLCILSVCAASFTANAWGPEGHRITAEIAMEYLKEDAKAEIAKILRGQSLPDAALWADEIRDDEKYDWSKPLHYINVPRRATSMDMSRDCENSMCVVSAIQRFEKQLRDESTSPAERLEALRFLVHFIGDIHQPLHVSYRDDLGGNQIDVTYMGRESNLHRVWDTDLIRTRMDSNNPEELARQLFEKLRSVSGPLEETWRKSLDPETWANQSLLITRSIYRSLPRGGELDENYYEAHINDVENQLMMAGVRMAALLNDIYSPAKETDEEESPKQREMRDALAVLALVEGDECGDGGRIMYLVNRHESRVIQTRIRRSWQAPGKAMSHETTEVVRPGESSKRELGCTHWRAGRDVREFTWEILEARFR